MKPNIEPNNEPNDESNIKPNIDPNMETNIQPNIEPNRILNRMREKKFTFPKFTYRGHMCCCVKCSLTKFFLTQILLVPKKFWINFFTYIFLGNFFGLKIGLIPKCFGSKIVLVPILF